MILIDDILISDDIIQQHFVCNLSACKGACCVEGESGAPLEPNEIEELKKNYGQIKKYITPAGMKVIKEEGFFTKDKRGKFKTPLVKGGACAYLSIEKDVAKCGIQKAFEDGKINFQKPISCHLYPIRITRSRMKREHVNYEEWDICDPACEFGKKLKIPLYVFVKDALIRKFGISFYDALKQAASQLRVR